MAIKWWGPTIWSLTRLSDVPFYDWSGTFSDWESSLRFQTVTRIFLFWFTDKQNWCCHGFSVVARTTLQSCCVYISPVVQNFPYSSCQDSKICVCWWKQLFYVGRLDFVSFSSFSHFWVTPSSKYDTPTAPNLDHTLPTSFIHWGIWNYFIKTSDFTAKQY